MISVTPVRLGFVAMLTAAGTFGAHEAAIAQGPGAPVKLAPHVAIYDLTLTSSRGKRSLEGVRGRIVYDFSGSAAVTMPPSGACQRSQRKFTTCGRITRSCTTKLV